MARGGSTGLTTSNIPVIQKVLIVLPFTEAFRLVSGFLGVFFYRSHADVDPNPTLTLTLILTLSQADATIWMI